jgi:hypothetical protein
MIPPRRKPLSPKAAALGSANRPQVAIPMDSEEDFGEDSDLVRSILAADPDEGADDEVDQDDGEVEGLPSDDGDLVGPVMSEEGIGAEGSEGDDDDEDEEDEDDDSLSEPGEPRVDRASEAPSPVSSEDRDPRSEPQMKIFEPLHNLREMSKQLLLLEDHLAHPAKFCPDCIRKHLLGAEALAEEAITLDKDGQYKDLLGSLPMQVRQISKDFTDNKDRSKLCQQARTLRKQLSKTSFSSVSDKKGAAAKIPSPPPVQPRAPSSNPSPAAAAPAVLTEAILEAAKRDLKQQGVFGVGRGANNTIVVYAKKDGVSVPSSFRGVRVVRLVADAPRIQKPFAAGSRARFGVDYASGLTAGMPVIYSAPRVDNPKLNEWNRGKLVAGVPQPDASGRFQVTNGTRSIMVPSDRILRAPRSPISSLLRGKSIQRYDMAGSPYRAYVLTEGKLVVADAIQSVFEVNLTDVCADLDITFGFSLGEDSEEGVARRKQACRVAIPGKILAAAIVNAMYESNLDPNIVAASEPSVGLWQLNANGAGAGMTVAERQDIKTSTERILQEMKRRASDSSIFRQLVMRDIASASAGTPAAAPTVAEYTSFWTVEVERPKEPQIAAKVRAKTAAALFSGPSAQKPFEKPPEETVEQTVERASEKVKHTIEAPFLPEAPPPGAPANSALVTSLVAKKKESDASGTGLMVAGTMAVVGVLTGLVMLGVERGSRDSAHIPGPYARPGAMVKLGSFDEIEPSEDEAFEFRGDLS